MFSDVVDGGAKLANGRIFIDCEKEETPDGFRVDVDGNLWCGWGMSLVLDGIKVFNPAGKAIGFIALPERAANAVVTATGCSWRRATRSIRST
jgi:gluconolactonase